MADIARRFSENPLLRPADVRPSIDGMQVECLLNPGVFRFRDQTWLLLRVAERPAQTPGATSFPVLDAAGGLRILEFDNADPKLNLEDSRVINYDGRDYLTTMSHLRLVASDDGVHFREPANFSPMFGQGDLEAYGIEDCRVTEIDSTYYLTFTAVSEHGVGVGLRSTADWRNIRSHGMILPPHNKDCAIFSEQIAGKYYALHRPSSPWLGGNYIWLAESPDLVHWGGHRCLVHGRPGMWDSAASAPARRRFGPLRVGSKSITAPTPTTAIASERCCWISMLPGRSLPARTSRSWNRSPSTSAPGSSATSSSPTGILSTATRSQSITAHPIA